MLPSPLKADRKYKNVRLDLFTISAIHTGYSYDNIGPFTAHEQSPSWRDIIKILLWIKMRIKNLCY